MSSELRINLTLSTKAMRRLEYIQTRLDASSTAETVRIALRIADFITEQIDEGNEVCIKKSDGSITEIRLFI